MNCNQNFKISQVTEETLVLGVDVGSATHYVRAFNWRGLELSKVFKFKNSFDGRYIGIVKRKDIIYKAELFIEF
ncbi:MAG: hypothetical protein ACLVH9_04650 [Fusobacterium sp.]|uniref:hypothetical protein n=1 Tax=Fusobacterium sp. TaxID=68766 RepID=UPI00399C3385